MRINLDTSSVDDYATFLKVKELPHYRFDGRTAVFPDEYAERLGLDRPRLKTEDYCPHPSLWDYQEAIASIAIEKRKFCVFADCGLGKTLIFLEFAQHVRKQIGNKRVLIISPLMVIDQTIEECTRFYGSDLGIEKVPASELREWMHGSGGIGITNFEAIRPDLTQGNVGCIIIDESSMLKSHYGKWGTKILDLGRGLDWKMACTGTPAPNDRIEYANHAVFMDAFPNVNAFLARFFVNRGQTNERWELKKHAIGPFYRALSHWCIFLSNPSIYGWSDNTRPLPPVDVHIHDVPMTNEQQSLAYDMTGQLFAHNVGGIGNRSRLGQIAKGQFGGKEVATNKPQFVRDLIDQWQDESTIVWCLYNYEQDQLAKVLPDAASISGSSTYEQKREAIRGFKAGQIKTLITKPKILGFGLNLQVATRQVFSGLQDSYESYYQAVKRSNRYGSVHTLNVHIPITDIERPMIETVLAKAERVDADTKAQERLFREASII